MMNQFASKSLFLTALSLQPLLNVGCAMHSGEDTNDTQSAQCSGAGGSSDSNDSSSTQLPHESAQHDADSSDEYEAICPEPTINEENIDVPDFVEQPFRYKAIDYSLTQASLHRTATCVDEITTMDDELVIRGTATNRIDEGRSFALDFGLLLADGTSIGGYADERKRLEPEGQSDFVFRFALPDDASLAGAQLQPTDRHDAGEFERVWIPLDAPYVPSYPFNIPELTDLEAKTLSGDSSDQWSMKVLSALVTMDSDYDGGRHAAFGKKFVELIVNVQLHDAPSNALLGYNTFELMVDGFSVYPKIEGGLLYKNQQETDIILFEIDDEVTQFDFVYDLDRLQESDNDFGMTSKAVSVQLPPLDKN